MSRPIKMTEKHLEECRADFEKALKLTKLADGKLNFVKQFTIDSEKATIYFTAEAWTKMVILLKEFDKEVAWHGVATRLGEEGNNDYLISDIVVYPQEVTGTTVDMDPEKYTTWLIDNVDDDRFKYLCMQGHSHVNMGTSPSGTDIRHQEEILNMLDDEDFYIFMIWNKSFASTNKIYDLKKNILFEDKDISVKLYGSAEGFDEFLENAKSMVKTKTYTYSGNTTGYSGNYNNGYTYGGNTGYGTTSTAPYNPVTPASGSAQNSSKKTKKTDEKKQTVAEKPKTKIGAGWQGKNACQTTWADYDINDFDDPYGAYMGE